jgi:hypothetical protein
MRNDIKIKKGQGRHSKEVENKEENDKEEEENDN